MDRKDRLVKKQDWKLASALALAVAAAACDAPVDIGTDEDVAGAQAAIDLGRPNASSQVGGGLIPSLRIVPDFDGFQAQHPWVGARVGGVVDVNGQVFSQEFATATAYAPMFASSSGVHEIHGSIRARYLAPGDPDGWLLLGFPITNETGTPDGVGRYNHFERGSIYWHPVLGAHEIHGAIRDLWAALGWEQSALGYPTSDELPLPGGGRQSHFEHGSIYWTPTYGAVALFENLEGSTPDDRLVEVGHDGLVWYVSLEDEQVRDLEAILNGDGWLISAIRDWIPGGDDAVDQLRKADRYVKIINAMGGNHGVDVQGLIGIPGVIVTPRGFGLYRELVRAARVAVSGANILEFVLGSAALSPELGSAFGVGLAAEIYHLVVTGNPWPVAFGIAAVDWVLGGSDDPDEHGGVHADRDEIGPWESFTLAQVDDSGDVALLSWQGFFSAIGGGGGNVYANRPQVGEWERWRLIDNHDGTISLQTHDGLHYLKAIGGGGSYCQASGESVGPWERFTLEPLPGGKVALRTWPGGQVVSVQSGL